MSNGWGVIFHLEDIIEFRGEHNVALGLKFASHESFLAIKLPRVD